VSSSFFSGIKSPQLTGCHASHCSSKAQTAHTLLHWRYHVNEWVVDYLESQDMLRDDQVLQRSRWSQTRQAAGDIDRLWRDFRFIVRAARDTKVRRVSRAASTGCTGNSQ
jgi:hypothetical protein